uniref:BAH domain-containing protein n=1 Tax=Strongyloides papillosus TaxID=174720 RepID=A0A0N5B8V7_STREA
MEHKKGKTSSEEEEGKDDNNGTCQQKPSSPGPGSDSSKSSVTSEYTTAPSSLSSGKSSVICSYSTASSSKVSGKSSTTSEYSTPPSSKASGKEQEITPSITAEVEKSIVKRNEIFQKLATVELPNYKFYRLRDQDKDKITIGKSLSISTNVHQFKFSDNLYVDLYSVHFLNSEKKIDEKIRQSKKRDVVMKILYREIKNKSDLNNFVYDDHNLLYVKSGIFKEKKYEYCVDPDARRAVYVRFEKAKHLPIVLSNTDNTTFL